MQRQFNSRSIVVGVVLMVVGFLASPCVLAQSTQDEQASEPKTSSYKKYRSKQKQMRDEQIADEKAFRRSLRGKTIEEKRAALEARRAAQQAAKPDFTPKIHAENLRILKKAIRKVRGLSREEKDGLAYFFEDQYVQSISFADEESSEHLDFFRLTVSDPGMSIEQKKEVLKQFVLKHEKSME